MAYLNTKDPLLQHAVDVIFGDFGDVVSVEEKKKDLIKFGRNEAVGTTLCTIWYTGQDQTHEQYVADNLNLIDSISSSSLLDTMDVKVEGHTMTGGDRTFVVQTATLSGQTRVALTTALNRVTRVYNASSTDIQGEVYVYRNGAISSGKPTSTNRIHLTVPLGENQSQKASTSVSSTDYWIVTGFSGGALTKTGSNVNEVRLEVRRVGEVFRPVSKPVVFGIGGDSFRKFEPYIIIPKNADVRLTTVSSGTNQNITGDIQGFLAKII